MGRKMIDAELCLEENTLGDRLQQAENGAAEAQYDLGLLYATGHGVVQNFVEAHKWFNLAAIHGIGQAEVDRCDVALEMDTRDIAEAQRLARQWETHH